MHLQCYVPMWMVTHIYTSMNIVILALDCCQTGFPAVMAGYRFFMFPFPPVKPLMSSDIS